MNRTDAARSIACSSVSAGSKPTVMIVPPSGAGEARRAPFDERLDALGHVARGAGNVLGTGLVLERLLEARRRGPVQEPLDQAHRRRGPARQPSPPLHRVLRQLPGFDDLVAQSPGHPLLPPPPP